MLKLVTYNINKGGPEDYTAWGRTLAELEPDILFLHESSEPRLYRERVATAQQKGVDRAVWRKAGSNYWGSAIYSRHGFVEPLQMPEEFQGWVTAADVRSLPWYPGERPLRLFCLHTPTREDGNYLREVNRIIDIIGSIAHGHDLIVGGDFNITVSLRHEAEPRQNVIGEPQTLRRLQRELGLINCWQTLHPNQALPQTHQHKFQADSAPHHLDGLFVPASWYRYLDTCDILNGAPWLGRSDHFPVVASFA